MKRINKSVMILLLMLLCAMASGCRTSDMNALSTTTTQPTDVVHTVKLVTRGGWPVSDVHITVYADAALTQQITTIHTDFDGIATYTGSADGTYYMVLDEKLKSWGFVGETCYAVTEEYTELLVDIALLTYDFAVKPGDVMCEINEKDWNGNQFVLSDRMKVGKPCIIWACRSSMGSGERLAMLQSFYEKHGNKMEVLLFTGNHVSYDMQQSGAECGITFPAVSINQSSTKWMEAGGLMIIDRYGMVVLRETTNLPLMEEMLEAAADYFTDENYRQDRVFADRKELLDHVDSLKAEEDVTYRVKVVDGEGKPLKGVLLDVFYPYRGFSLRTDEQGIATFTMYPRDDIQVQFARLEHNAELYLFENEGLFEAGAMEKTLVLQEREKTTYTVRAVDTEGNPVRFVTIRTIPYGQFIHTNENGLLQWESVIVEEPFAIDESDLPGGYLLGPITREGDVFTVLVYPIVTYLIKVVDQNGNPVSGVRVDLYEEGHSEMHAYGVTHTDGVAKIYAKAGKFLVKIYDKVHIDGTWYEYRYGTFELEEGVTEITIVVGEPETVK